MEPMVQASAAATIKTPGESTTTVIEIIESKASDSVLENSIA